MFAPIAREVKNEILEKIKKGEKVLALSHQYGVSEKTIYTWLRKKALGTVSLLEYNRLKNENHQLKQIIGVLTLHSGDRENKKKEARLLFLYAIPLNRSTNRWYQQSLA